MAVSTPSSTARSPSTSAARGDKNKKPTKIVTIRLSPKLLRRFEPVSTKEEEQSTPSLASSPAPVADDDTTLKVPEAIDNGSESNSTPAPNGTDGTPDPSKKRKGLSAGAKRSLGQGVESNGMKARGKPGPKKKPRLEDGTIDHGAPKPAVPIITGIAAPRLGPKANQGAINAGLRALDRSGKPCRKWIKKPFQLKSFTGVTWDVPSWKGHEQPFQLNGDESSDTRDISLQSSSDIKPNGSDGAVESNGGDHHDPMIMSTPAASSPAPIPAGLTAIAAEG